MPTKEDLESKYKEVSTEYVDLNNKLNVALLDNSTSLDDMTEMKKNAAYAKTRMQTIKAQIDAMNADERAKASVEPAKKLKDAGSSAKIKGEQQVKAFKNMLISGDIRDAVTGGIGLQQGSVLIPEQILAPEHDQPQFPHLKDMIRTIAVTSTTGKLPVFQTSNDVMKEHTEFTSTDNFNAKQIKPVNYDLKSYTAQYVYSQELLSDSAYDWEAEIRQTMMELEDNTDDVLITQALTQGVTAATTTSANLIKDLKHILNKQLLPIDSQAATLLMSQSAYDDLDSLTDTMGRGLFETDLTSPSGSRFKGRPIVTVSDVLFPNAKDGDENVVVAPLPKAIINFKQSTITGQFQDTHDMWYKALGIYLRQNIVKARKDVIFSLTTSSASGKASGK